MAKRRQCKRTCFSTLIIAFLCIGLAHPTVAVASRCPPRVPNDGNTNWLQDVIRNLGTALPSSSKAPQSGLVLSPTAPAQTPATSHSASPTPKRSDPISRAKGTIAQLIELIQATTPGDRLLKETGLAACFGSFDTMADPSKIPLQCPDIQLVDNLQIGGKPANGITLFSEAGMPITIRLKRADLNLMAEVLAHELLHLSHQDNLESINETILTSRSGSSRQITEVDTPRYGLILGGVDPINLQGNSGGNPLASLMPKPNPAGGGGANSANNAKSLSDVKEPKIKSGGNPAVDSDSVWYWQKRIFASPDPIDLCDYRFFDPLKKDDYCNDGSFYRFDDKKLRTEDEQNQKKNKPQQPGQQQSGGQNQNADPEKANDVVKKNTASFILGAVIPLLERHLGKEWQPLVDSKKATERENERRKLMTDGKISEAAKIFSYADQANKDFLEGWFDKDGKPDHARIAKFRKDFFGDVLKLLKAHQSSEQGQKSIGELPAAIMESPVMWSVDLKNNKLAGGYLPTNESILVNEFGAEAEQMLQQLGASSADPKQLEPLANELFKAIKQNIDEYKQLFKEKKVKELTVEDLEKLHELNQTKAERLAKIRAKIDEIKKKSSGQNKPQAGANGANPAKPDNGELIKDTQAKLPGIFRKDGDPPELAKQVTNAVCQVLGGRAALDYSVLNDNTPSSCRVPSPHDQRTRLDPDAKPDPASNPDLAIVDRLFAEETEAWLYELGVAKQLGDTARLLSREELFKLLLHYDGIYRGSLGVGDSASPDSSRTDHLRTLFDSTIERVSSLDSGIRNLFPLQK